MSGKPCGKWSCCCTCRHHAVDAGHPLTNGESIMTQRGFVCLAPEFDVVLSGWSAHGLCEMWSPVRPSGLSLHELARKLPEASS
jgi:hypothetical protein